jgi:hypothetical protein
VLYLIIKPFLGKKRGLTRNEVLSRAVEHQMLKDAAANLTNVPDAMLESVIAAKDASRKAGAYS